MALQCTLLPPQTGGRLRRPPAYTQAEAQKLADQHLAQAYRFGLRTHLIELVAGYGSLTGHQLHRLAQRTFSVTKTFSHFERNLTNLCEAGLLQPRLDIAPALRHEGLQLPGAKAQSPTDTRYRVYGLGVVGFPFARQVWADLGYDARALLPSDSALHDVLCAEVMLRLAEQDPRMELRSSAQAALWNDENDTFFCRPDGLLISYLPPGRVVQDAWWVEFCNERWSTPARVEHKLALYRQLSETQRWGEWGLNWAPRLLIIYRARSTGRAFAQATAHWPRPTQTVYGLDLSLCLGAARVPDPQPIGESLQLKDTDE